MPRHKKVSEPELKNWEDVNKALREIAECEIGIETLETEMNMKINDAKKEAEKLGKPLKTAVTLLTAQIQEFVEENKDDFEGKSKELNFGTVGFRQSTRISYSTKKTDELIEKLKKYNMHNCINIKESVNKQALMQYSAKDILRVGAKRITEDKFYLETDKEKLH